jgi:hypothetical protein
MKNYKISCPFCKHNEYSEYMKASINAMVKHIRNKHPVKWFDELIRLNGKRKMAIFFLAHHGFDLMPNQIWLGKEKAIATEVANKL